MAKGRMIISSSTTNWDASESRNRTMAFVVPSHGIGLRISTIEEDPVTQDIDSPRRTFTIQSPVS